MDASSVALGAVLSQEVDGGRQPVAFISKTLTQQERKSSDYELAVVFALDKFRRFFEHAEFLLETDNQAFSWVVKISFKFRVQHIRRSQNVVSDTLSRTFSTSNEPSPEQPCALLLNFPLAFTEILPHQLEDEELGPIINKIKGA